MLRLHHQGLVWVPEHSRCFWVSTEKRSSGREAGDGTMAGRPGELVTLGRQALPPYSPSSGGAGKGSLLRGGVRPTEAKGAGDSRWPRLTWHTRGGRVSMGVRWSQVHTQLQTHDPVPAPGNAQACPLPSTCPRGAFSHSGCATALSSCQASRTWDQSLGAKR